MKMAKRQRQSTNGKQRKEELLNAHNALKQFVERSGDAETETEDPRFQKFVAGKPVSRRERRKEERVAKKARNRAYHSTKRGAPVMVCSLAASFAFLFHLKGRWPESQRSSGYQ